MALRCRLVLAVILLVCSSVGASSACLDLKSMHALSLEGVLAYEVFPGAPNFEDVRKGDMPEPTYILLLEKPLCVTGDESISPDQAIERVQIFPAFEGKNGKQLWSDLHRLIGSRVSVEGNDAFGAHTGHHHAPLVMAITSLAAARSTSQEPKGRQAP